MMRQAENYRDLRSNSHAENQNKNKCAHPACDCPREEEASIAASTAMDAEKAVVLEIVCALSTALSVSLPDSCYSSDYP